MKPHVLERINVFLFGSDANVSWICVFPGGMITSDHSYISIPSDPVIFLKLHSVFQCMLRPIIQ